MQGAAVCISFLPFVIRDRRSWRKRGSSDRKVLRVFGVAVRHGVGLRQAPVLVVLENIVNYLGSTTEHTLDNPCIIISAREADRELREGIPPEGVNQFRTCFPTTGTWRDGQAVNGGVDWCWRGRRKSRRGRGVERYDRPIVIGNRRRPSRYRSYACD